MSWEGGMQEVVRKKGSGETEMSCEGQREGWSAEGRGKEGGRGSMRAGKQLVESVESRKEGK
jgi:hypothetical protein